RFVAHGAHYEGGGARVTRIDDAAQPEIGEQKGLRLVHDQRGGELLNRAVEGRDRDVGGRERSLGQRGRQLFGRRLAAALEVRAEGQDGGHGERVQGGGEDDPQGKVFGPAARKADEPP